MRSLGDKISSTIVAQHAQVPCMDWSGQGVDQVIPFPPPPSEALIMMGKPMR
jgi:biotin carboxylase